MTTQSNYSNVNILATKSFELNEMNTMNVFKIIKLINEVEERF